MPSVAHGIYLHCEKAISICIYNCGIPRTSVCSHVASLSMGSFPLTSDSKKARWGVERHIHWILCHSLDKWYCTRSKMISHFLAHSVFSPFVIPICFFSLLLLPSVLPPSPFLPTPLFHHLSLDFNMPYWKLLCNLPGLLDKSPDQQQVHFSFCLSAP